MYSVSRVSNYYRSSWAQFTGSWCSQPRSQPAVALGKRLVVVDIRQRRSATHSHHLSLTHSLTHSLLCSVRSAILELCHCSHVLCAIRISPLSVPPWTTTHPPPPPPPTLTGRQRGRGDTGREGEGCADQAVFRTRHYYTAAAAKMVRPLNYIAAAAWIERACDIIEYDIIGA